MKTRSSRTGTIEISYPLLGRVDPGLDHLLEKIMSKPCDISGASLCGKPSRYLHWHNQKPETLTKAKSISSNILFMAVFSDYEQTQTITGLKFKFWTVPPMKAKYGRWQRPSPKPKRSQGSSSSSGQFR